MDDLRARGARVFRAGARVVIRPRRLATRKERARIAAHETAVLELVDWAANYAASCPAHLAGIGSRRIGPTDICSICRSSETPVHYGDSVVDIPYCRTCVRDPHTERCRQYTGRLQSLWREHESGADPYFVLACHQEIDRLLDVVGVARAAELRDFAAFPQDKETQ